MQNSFRIISGDFRGRKFSFPEVEGLRPTSGKIRETLFSWLLFEILNKTQSIKNPFEIPVIQRDSHDI